MCESCKLHDLEGCCAPPDLLRLRSVLGIGTARKILAGKSSGHAVPLLKDDMLSHIYQYGGFRREIPKTNMVVQQRLVRVCVQFRGHVTCVLGLCTIEMVSLAAQTGRYWRSFPTSGHPSLSYRHLQRSKDGK